MYQLILSFQIKKRSSSKCLRELNELKLNCFSSEFRRCWVISGLNGDWFIPIQQETPNQLPAPLSYISSNQLRVSSFSNSWRQREEQEPFESVLRTMSCTEEHQRIGKRSCNGPFAPSFGPVQPFSKIIVDLPHSKKSRNTRLKSNQFTW